MILARDFPPLGRVGRRDRRVAGGRERDFGEFDTVGERQEELVDFIQGTWA